MSDTEKPQVPSSEAPLQRPEPKPGPPPALGDQGASASQRRRELDAEIENELQAAMAGLSDKEMYGDLSKDSRKKPAPGRQKGKVLTVRGPDVFIDVPGGRSQGVIPVLQFPEGVPAVGTEIDFHIEGYDGANGLLLLSRQGAAIHADWSTVAEGMIVEARVTATNKGGLSVDVNSIRGFMPISQIDLYRVENTEQFINQRLKCLVTEVNQAEHNLVVSRRALLEKEREEQREKFWQQVAEGQVRDGIVRSIRDFGAFVDLGGADGLLHVSEMAWARVQDPTSVLQVGQPVKVVVLKVDAERRKLSLGMKQLTASPWEQINEKFPENHVVPGKVTRLMDFGAFVELEPGIEGLVHISELSPQRVRRVGDVVQIGQEVQVMVLRVDPAQRKISLSLKAVTAKAEEAEAESAEETPAETKPPRPRKVPLRGGIGDAVEEDIIPE